MLEIKMCSPEVLLKILWWVQRGGCVCSSSFPSVTSCLSANCMWKDTNELIRRISPDSLLRTMCKRIGIKKGAMYLDFLKNERRISYYVWIVSNYFKVIPFVPTAFHLKPYSSCLYTLEYCKICTGPKWHWIKMKIFMRSFCWLTSGSVNKFLFSKFKTYLLTKEFQVLS